MKKKVLTLVGILLMTLFAGTMFADNDAALFKNAGISIDKVIEDAGKQNLKNIKTIEFDDGQWELKTQVNSLETEYNYNPQTSKFSQLKQETENDLQPPVELTSLQNAVRVAQDKGYNVYSAEFEGKSWEIESYDSKNLEYTIFVNVTDGKIINIQQDN